MAIIENDTIVGNHWTCILNHFSTMRFVLKKRGTILCGVTGVTGPRQYGHRLYCKGIEKIMRIFNFVYP